MIRSKLAWKYITISNSSTFNLTDRGLKSGTRELVPDPSDNNNNK